MSTIAEARTQDIELEIDDKIKVINNLLEVARIRDYGDIIEFVVHDESYANEHAEDRHKIVCLNDYIAIIMEEVDLLRDEKEELFESCD